MLRRLAGGVRGLLRFRVSSRALVPFTPLSSYSQGVVAIRQFRPVTPSIVKSSICRFSSSSSAASSGSSSVLTRDSAEWKAVLALLSDKSTYPPPPVVVASPAVDEATDNKDNNKDKKKKQKKKKTKTPGSGAESLLSEIEGEAAAKKDPEQERKAQVEKAAQANTQIEKIWRDNLTRWHVR